MDKDNKVDFLIETGAATTGAAVGAVVAGPAGAVVGAATGSLVQGALQFIGQEIKNRQLSKREEKKIGTLYDFAKQKVSSNIESGREIRKDDFFSPQESFRAASEEITEEVFLAAQRESEEKKLPFLANLYANVLFDETIDKGMAFQLFRMAEELTYRQLVIISVIAFAQIASKDIGIPILRKEPFKTIEGFKKISLATDIFDLYRKSIIQSSSACFDPAGITPADLSVGGCGAMLLKLMELQTLPLDDTIYDILALVLSNMHSVELLINHIKNNENPA